MPEIIRRIKELNREIGYGDAGEILQKYNDCTWAPLTIRGYGIKIINWLREAEIIEENNEYGKYHISPSFLKEHESLFVYIVTIDELRKNMKNTDIVHSNPLKEIHNDSRYNITLGNLNRWINWIRYSENNNWVTNHNIKQKLYDDLNTLTELIMYYDRENSDWTTQAKKWLNQAFKHGDKECIEHFADIIHKKLDKGDK